jgi:hypothetical protein
VVSVLRDITGVVTGLLAGVVDFLSPGTWGTAMADCGWDMHPCAAADPS